MKKNTKLFVVLILVLILLSTTIMACESKNITVKFDTQGGDAIDSMQIEKGKSIANLPVPVRSGYKFSGWYTKSDFSTGSEFKASDIVSTDLTLYAKWIKIINVLFETNGGTEIRPQEILIGSTATNPEIPIKDKYIFDGWYTSKTFEESKKFDFSTPLTEDLTLYAKWLGKFELKFESNGKVVEKQVLVEGDFAQKPEEIIEDGYVFVGWYEDSEFTTPFDFSASVDKDMSVYAKWIQATDVSYFEFNEKDDGSWSIRGRKNNNTSDMKQFVIPSHYQGKPVTEVGSSAFYGYKYMEKIYIPDTVTDIAADAFSQCSALSEVRVSDNVTEYAFAGKITNLSKINLGAKAGIGFTEYFKNLKKVEEVSVNPENKLLCEKDKVIYSKNMQTVLYVPALYSGELAIQEGVLYADEYLLYSASMVTSLIYPDSLIYYPAVSNKINSLKNVYLGANLDERTVNGLDTNWYKLIKNYVSENIEISISENNKCLKVGEGKNILSTDNILICAVTDSEIVRINIYDYIIDILPEFASNLWYLDQLYIGKMFKNAEIFRENKITIMDIEISEENDKYYLESGILFSKDGVVLACDEMPVIDELVIPKEVENIQPGDFDPTSDYYTIFMGKPSFKKLSVEEGSLLKSIGRYAFAAEDWGMIWGYEYVLETVDLTNATQLEYIGDYAFSRNEKLVEVILPGVKHIGQFAFEGTYTTNYLVRVVMSEGTEIIDVGAFAGNKVLESINIPESVVEIKDVAFGNNDKLLNEDGAFIYNNQLVSLETTASSYIIPANVNKIWTNAITQSYQMAASLKTLYIHDNVEVMMANAISKIDDIVIKIEYSEEAVPEGWASDCISSENTVIWDCKNNYSDSDGNVYFSKDNFEYILKQDKTAILRITTTELNGEIIVPQSVMYNNEEYVVKEIGNNAFKNQQNITKVILPEGLVKIGNNAFEEASLTSVVLPSTLNEIGDYAFYYADIIDIDIPEGVTTINKFAFAYTQLQNVKLPSTLTRIEERAFLSCSQLTEIVIPANVEFIGAYALLTDSLNNAIFEKTGTWEATAKKFDGTVVSVTVEFTEDGTQNASYLNKYKTYNFRPVSVIEQ